MLFGRSIGAAIHFYLRAAHEWGRLFVYIQTSNIRIGDILQNEENFKSFLVSPGYVCKARSHWCQRKVYYLSILLLPTFICLLSLKKSWWLYGWEQTANTDSAGTGSFSRSKSGCRVEQELNVQRTRIFWIELLDAAANHRWQQLTSRQKWCRVHLTFSSTAPEWVCIDLSLPSAGWNCISGVHSHCSCSAECMCIFIFIRSSSCIKAEGTLTMESTVGI